MKSSVKRIFQPLEEWIYLKIYINPLSSNLVLHRYIAPIVNEIYPAVSTKWFFLRYKDTHYHLRLRFWIPNASKIADGMRIIHCHLKRAQEDGYVHRWSIDGYERELERYGVENIVTTEEYFCINSSFLVNAVWEISNNDCLTNCLVLSMMHISLTNFLPDLDERLRLCENNMRSLYSEFGLSERYIRLLNDMYRRYRLFTDAIIADREENMFNGNINNLLKEYRNQLETFIGKMDNEVYTSINLRSIIHLDVNRAYEIDARRIEMVLYYILYKAYNAEKYRTKALKNSK